MPDKNSLLEKIDGIYDIQPPALPELTTIEYSLFVALGILIITAVIYLGWKLFFSNRSYYKRKIKHLQNALTNNNISSHDAIYQLCYFLRKGLKLKHLTTHTTLPKQSSSNIIQWQSFILKLSDLRYKNNPPSSSDIKTTLKESLYWLKVWP